MFEFFIAGLVILVS